jgi:uncharacterized membrane protein (UPF0127 family)
MAGGPSASLALPVTVLSVALLAPVCVGAVGLAAAGLGLGACGDGCPDEVRVRGAHGESRIACCVERARTEDERRRGLSGRRSLGSRHGLPAGLLLEFPLEGEACITNAPVSFAIDVVFAARDGTIVRVDRDVAPGDPTARCAGRTYSVLEAEAGVLEAVEVGDVLDDPARAAR